MCLLNQSFYENTIFFGCGSSERSRPYMAQIPKRRMVIGHGHDAERVAQGITFLSLNPWASTSISSSVLRKYTYMYLVTGTTRWKGVCDYTGLHTPPRSRTPVFRNTFLFAFR